MERYKSNYRIRNVIRGEVFEKYQDYFLYPTDEGTYLTMEELKKKTKRYKLTRMEKWLYFTHLILKNNFHTFRLPRKRL